MSTTYAPKQAPAQKKDAPTAASVLDSSSQGESLQRKADMANNAAQRAEAPRPNNTGMPDNLKAGIESLSGFSMDDVRVHYNSSKPATVQALAYTQGTDIHVAPGQEKHLPHEAWHVAQQMAGRVSPTTNINGMPVNDNAGLEHEANVMGEKAVKQSMENVASVSQFKNSTEPIFADVMQCAKEEPSGHPNTYFNLSYIPIERREEVKNKLRNIIDVMFGVQGLDKIVGKIVVVVIPYNIPMTALNEFKNMASGDTGGVGGNRSWNYVRGCGGNKINRAVYVGVTEENLLGTDTTVLNADNYEKGYSTTTHEIAHSIHLYRMDYSEKKQITELYNEKLDKMANDENAWPDGRCLNVSDYKRLKIMSRRITENIKARDVTPSLKDKMCYASQTEQEYYAQSVNTFLGTNAGVDPLTLENRHNGKDWLKNNDPTMYKLLVRRYGENAEVKDANPRRKS